MRKIILLLLVLPVNLWAQTDGCQLPNATISDCPPKYIPKPVVPSRDTRNQIDAYLNGDLKVAVKAEDDAVHALRAANLLLNGDQGVIYRYPDYYKAHKGKTQEEYTADIRDRERDLKAATNAQYAAHNEAIRMTVIAYGLTPPITDFSREKGLLSSVTSMPAWSLRYSEREFCPDEGKWKCRKLKDEEIADDIEKRNAKFGPHGLKGGSRVAETDGSTGAISVYRQAFDSPEALAVKIPMRPPIG